MSEILKIYLIIQEYYIVYYSIILYTVEITNHEILLMISKTLDSGMSSYDYRSYCV